MRGRAERRAGGVLRPVRRGGAGRRGALPPAAGQHAQGGGQNGEIRVRHHLLLPRRGCAHRPGGVPRHHCLRPHGGGRLRLRPGVFPAQAEKDLCPAHGGGEERHLPPRAGAGGVPDKAGGIFEEVNPDYGADARRAAGPRNGVLRTIWQI